MPGELTILGFGGVFEEQYRKTVLAPFAAKYPTLGINYSTAGLSAQNLGALRAQRKAPLVDVALLEASTSIVANREGLFEELTNVDVPSLRDLYPQAIIDPGFGPAVTFDHLVIVYDAAKIRSDPRNISALWQPEYRGRIGIAGMPNSQAIVLTLMTSVLAGEDYTRSIDVAIRMLAELAPAVQTFAPAPDGYTMVLNGALDLATGWNGRAQYYRSASGGRLGVLLPKEGNVTVMNTINLVKGAKNRAAAVAFIEHALSPATQKAFAEAMFYAPVNRRAVVSDDVAERTLARHLQGTATVDWHWIATVRDQWNRRWRREVVTAEP